MRIFTKFDSKKDLMETTPGLAMDLAVALDSGVVMDTGSLGEYNDLDDPRCIHGKIRDAFEAIDAQRGIQAQYNRFIALKDAAAAAAAAAAAVSTSKGEGE